MKEYSFEINGREYDVTINSVSDARAEVMVNGVAYTVKINDKPSGTTPDKQGDRQASYEPTPVTSPLRKSDETTIKSPLPGVISAIRVKVGDKVSVGQEVVVLEAMKMENSIEAEVYGTVKAIHVERGDSVLEGEGIITIG